VDRTIRHAEALEATDAHAAGALWARLDRELVDRAAWVPLVNPRNVDFVSRRVENYQYTTNTGILADQLWLRR
jgi:ABC-type transport system substrate-binding protein